MRVRAWVERPSRHAALLSATSATGKQSYTGMIQPSGASLRYGGYCSLLYTMRIQGQGLRSAPSYACSQQVRGEVVACMPQPPGQARGAPVWRGGGWRGWPGEGAKQDQARFGPLSQRTRS